MHTVTELTALRQVIDRWRQEGKTIGFVPTMGNLHAGHLRLVQRAREDCDRAVVSVFVNPAQFGPNEDYDAYPRTLRADEDALNELGCDLLYAPTVKDIYPRGVAATTTVAVPELTNDLCGASRPGHFDGVTTVVCKLLNRCQPTRAYLGEKDYQQLLVIRRMATDLDLPVEIVGVPTVRESDGLAMSSRNQYLSATERRIAPRLHAQLERCARRIREGEDADKALEGGRRELSELGFAVDYLELRRAADLAVAVAGDERLVLLVAAKLGDTRLIDNFRFSRGSSTTESSG